MKIDSVSGWIFLDKPIGITSNNALQKVKNLFGNCKAGYVGTLDPLASGFLPIALGKSTKTIKYMSNYNKEYIFEIRWGSQSSTGDFEGQVKKTSNRIPTKNEIFKAVKIFGSDYYQTPPKYSAKKINGTKAYELVRKNVDFELKKQKKKIFNLNVLDFFSDGKTLFYVKCESGTYVRTLAEDIADVLKTSGMIQSLKRIGVGNLDKKLISLDYLLSLVHIEDLLSIIKPVNLVFNQFNQIYLDKEEVEHILNGKPIKMNILRKQLYKFNKTEFTLAKFNNEFIAVGYLKDGNFYPKNLLSNFFV
jgi:tRNA pseudouridine55 synthase